MQGLQSCSNHLFGLLTIILCLLAQPGLAAEPVLITENTEELNLAILSDYYEDTEGALSLSDLKDPELQKTVQTSVQRCLQHGHYPFSYLVAF